METAVRVSLPSFPTPDPVAGARIEDPLGSELGGKQIERGVDEPLGCRIEVMLPARRQRLVRLDDHTDRLPAPNSMRERVMRSVGGDRDCVDDDALETGTRAAARAKAGVDSHRDPGAGRSSSCPPYRSGSEP
jgi:hypothetical protein